MREKNPCPLIKNQGIVWGKVTDEWRGGGDMEIKHRQRELRGID